MTRAIAIAGVFLFVSLGCKRASGPNPGPGASQTQQQSHGQQAKPGIDQWMGTYLKGAKIGYSHFQVLSTPTGFRVQEDGYMSLAMMGTPKELRSQLTVETDSSFRMKKMSFVMNTGDQEMRVEGRVSGAQLYLSVDDASGKSAPIEKQLPWRENTFLPQVWAGALLFGKAPTGLVWFYDPSTFSLDSALVEYKGEAQLEGQKVQKYTSLFMGATTTFYIKEGKIIQEDYPMDLSFRAEDRQTATSGVNAEPLDLLRTFSIAPTGKALRLNAKHVKYRLRNLKGNLDLEFAGVQDLLEKGPGYVIVQVSSMDPRGVPDRLEKTLDDSLVKKYTAPTSFIQSDDPDIMRIADSITAGISDDAERAESIMQWVFLYLDKRATVTVPSAREVLKSGYGDCNEHSILYAALARAAGIPTVVLAGLVYQGGRFYYHAWNASFVDGMWVPVDPIGGEFPASCGHIILKVGEIQRQSEIMPVVGSLAIEVLEVKDR